MIATSGIDSAGWDESARRRLAAPFPPLDRLTLPAYAPRNIAVTALYMMPSSGYPSAIPRHLDGLAVGPSVN
jgi:hypothetical protein